MPETPQPHAFHRRAEARYRPRCTQGGAVSARTEARLWLAQRVSAALLAVLVLVHLATIVHAVQGGLSAAEILGRTRGSELWLLFYGAFVVSAAIHAPIGMRNVLAEHLGWRGPSLDIALLALAGVLLALGGRAVWGVYA
ncbi:succinate dehydrogenase [Spiribacter halobius]|uniref:Succinate dehydrogenase n=1 Tax=Sediminicurvatus halobius TaxID=2182432 RepID=A0A2U2N8N4_9GAMM|nr:succinate dehydrogenase [Spiribacter halobius]